MHIRVCPMQSRKVVAAFVAFVLALAMGLVAPAAHAAEASTHTIGGVNYTLPSDWNKVEVSPAELDTDEVAQIDAYTKHDALFLALHIPTDPGDYATLDDFNVFASELSSMLVGTPLESVIVSAQLEQGCPTLTLYTNEIGFNDVVYALTVKLFAVDTGQTCDAVLMLSFLPASGVLTEDIVASMPYSDDPQSFQLADVLYELPGGFLFAEGYVFDFDFIVALGDAGALFGFDVPELAYDGSFDVTDLHAEMAEVAVELEEELFEQGLGGLLTDVWAGAYEFVGYPTVGLEFVINAGSEALAYVCATANITSSGTAFIALAQPAGSDFASYLLGNALVSAGNADDGAAASEAPQPTDPGFVIGFPVE